MNKAANVEYMTYYLDRALVLERNCYYWSTLLLQANSKMDMLYKNEKYLENAQRETKNALIALDNEPKEQETPCREKKKKSRIGLFPLSWWKSMFSLNDDDGEEEKLPISEESKRRQRILLTEKEKDCANKLAVTLVEQTVWKKRQEEIFEALQTAKNYRETWYAENVLDYKYRSLLCVATLCEYLTTGRCNTVQGHGGIYDTYEREKIELEKLYELMKMNRTLESIDQSQRLIAKEMVNLNYKVDKMNDYLKDIKCNTAISAEANKQTADNTRRIAEDARLMRMGW